MPLNHRQTHLPAPFSSVRGSPSTPTRICLEVIAKPKGRLRFNSRALGRDEGRVGKIMLNIMTNGHCMLQTD